jgi:hypothetical protein
MFHKFSFEKILLQDLTHVSLNMVSLKVLIIKLLQKGHYFKPSLHKNSLTKLALEFAEE